jgi:hypothetical protein
MLDGICVQTNGLDVDRDFVQVSVDMTFDLMAAPKTEYLQSIPLSVEFVVHYEHEGYHRHVCGQSYITIRYVPGCFWNYGALGHELIHYVQQHRGVEDEEHLEPYLWADWADGHGLNRQSTIEGKVFEHMRNMCRESMSDD